MNKLKKLKKLIDAYPDWCYARFGYKKGFLIAIIPIWLVQVLFMMLIFYGVFG